MHSAFNTLSLEILLCCRHYVYCELLDPSLIVDSILLFYLSNGHTSQAPKRQFLSPYNKNSPTEVDFFCVSIHWALDLKSPIQARW